jgi:hypothetical protein
LYLSWCMRLCLVSLHTTLHLHSSELVECLFQKDLFEK